MNRSFRLDSVAGAPINEYRVRSGRVEFRALSPEADPFQSEVWHPLTHDEIVVHLNLGTPVAKWLLKMWEEIIVSSKVS